MSPDKSLLILKTDQTIVELSARGEDFESWFAAGGAAVAPLPGTGALSR